jgi:hypothetical protein
VLCLFKMLEKGIVGHPIWKRVERHHLLSGP